MNIKLITKAMHTLSLLSEDDVQMVLKLRGLSEDERQMLMLVLEPGTKPSKKSSKKSASGGGRKSHGESLKQQISNRAQSSQSLTTTDNNDDDGTTPRCQAPRGDGRVCMLLADHNIHHLTTAMDYHPFVSTAQAAEPSSNQVTSEIGKGGAGDAHHAVSSGD